MEEALLEHLLVGDPDAEFDDVKMSGAEVAGAARGKVEVGVVGKNASLLEALNGIDNFDAHGWMGPKDPKGGFSDCMVILQMGATGFERVAPTETGTLDCDPSYVIKVTLDPVAEAAKIQ